MESSAESQQQLLQKEQQEHQTEQQTDQQQGQKEQKESQERNNKQRNVSPKEDDTKQHSSTTFHIGDSEVPGLVCREPSIVGGELLKNSEPIPVDPDDVERTERVEEVRHRNTLFWKKMFIESGVREEEQKPEGSVWKQRLTIAAVIVVVAAGISQAMYRAYIDVNFGFKYIDVKDTERLKAELPSGKTFSERFRIPSTTDAIIVTNGKTPRALNAWTFKTWENLSFFLQKSTRVDVTKVEDNVSFVKSCLHPPSARCIAFFRKGGFSAEGRKSVASALAQKGATRKLKAITIDCGKYEITRANIPTEPVYVTRVACFGNISPPPPPETKKSTDVSNYSFIFSLYQVCAVAFDGDWIVVDGVFTGEFTDTPALISFAEICIHSKEGTEGFSPLPQAPTLKRKSTSSSTHIR